MSRCAKTGLSIKIAQSLPARLALAADAADRVTCEVHIALNTGRMTAGQENRISGTRRPCVYLHIGEPKTGTTFLQDGLWNNRTRLATQGVQLPGYNTYDHFRASRDLREAKRQPSDPADPWTGDWDVLAAEALHIPGRAVISNELLAASSPQQADRAVRSLLPAEVHVVATVRDFAALLPAEWQEAVKCRGTTAWEPWLDEVVATERVAHRRRHSWFWRVHDTMAILDMWSQHIPPDRVHVVTVPRQNSADLLWTRFASVTGIDPEGCSLTGTRPNSSLGFAETEFLRRLNQMLPAELPDWFYTREIKQLLAHRVLRDRPPRSRPVLPPSKLAWAAEQAENLIAGLREAKYHVVGDLTDLRPAGRPGPGAGPSGELAGEQLEAAVETVVALVDRCYRLRFPVREPAQPRSARQRAVSMMWAMLNAPRIKRMLCHASDRAAARQLRVIIWRVLVRPGRHHGRPGPG